MFEKIQSSNSKTKIQIAGKNNIKLQKIDYKKLITHQCAKIQVSHYPLPRMCEECAKLREQRDRITESLYPVQVLHLSTFPDFYVLFTSGLNICASVIHLHTNVVAIGQPHECLKS